MAKNFLTAKKYLTIVGMLPTPEDNFSPKLQRYHLWLNIVHTTCVGVFILLYVCSVWCFPFFNSTSKTTTESVEVIIFGTISTARLVLFLIFVSKRSDILNLIKDLDETVEKRCCGRPRIRMIYSQNKNETEQVAKIILKCYFMAPILGTIQKVFASIYGYYVLDYSGDTFRLIYPATFPWNIKTPNGYLAALIVQYSWFIIGVLVIVSIFLIFVGICTLLQTFILDIGHSFEDLNDSVIRAEGVFTAEDCIILKKQLHNIMEFHSQAKLFASRLSTAYKAVILILFAISTTVLCSQLVVLNLAYSHQNYADIARSIIGLSLLFSYVTILCYFGDKVNSAFDAVNYSIYQCSWNEFPRNMQTVLVTFQINAQKVVHIKGLMNLQCSREVLKKIANGSWSSFNLLSGFR